MIIRAENLCKQYITYRRGSSIKDTVKSLFKREKVMIDAVNDISFSIGKGEIVGMLGRNGAGKSTTIKMLTGVLTPTSGFLEVMGYTPYTQRTRYVSHIGAVFGQKSQLIWDVPPLDSFQMNRAIYNIPKDEYSRNLDRLITLLDVQDIVSRPTRVLSLGERMKCEFVMAMLHSPSVVFLDEPTIGLDMIAKENIRTFIKEMNHAGVTFILTTHDLSDVEKLAKRVIIIDEGKKVFEDSLVALKRHLGNKKTAVIKTTVPVPPESIEHSGVSASSGDNDLMLTVDCDVLAMGDFLSWINSKCDILDISIQEQPIEEIIRTIYS